MAFQISGVYANLNSMLDNFVPYVTANAKRFHVSAEVIADLQELHREWKEKWIVYSSRGTQTSLAITEMGAIHKKMNSFVHKLQKNIKGNEFIELNAHEMEQLRIPETKSHHKSQQPFVLESPLNVLYEVKPLFAEVQTYTLGTIESKTLPAIVKFIWRELVYTEQGKKSHHSSYAPIDAVNKPWHTIQFPKEHAGKTAWLRTRYITTHGEISESSKPLKIIVVDDPKVPY